jgi:hypothetical protein
MNLLKANVSGNPREVNTKYGSKTVMDVRAENGQDYQELA